MAAPVERIERDLAALGEAIAILVTEFHSSYFSYLTSLGQAAQQQLILASYHICTQGYPDSFLHLSFAQRQQLQKALRGMAGQVQEQLLSHLQTPTLTDTENVTDDVPTLELKNPEHLAEWQENLEQAIAQTLSTLSRNTNRLIQQAGILPPQLPEALLEAAAQAEASTDGVAGPPNLLNLLIQAENSEDSEETAVTHIIALNLRLSEIEFADSTVMAFRKQIRNLLLRLSTLKREYQKKQRERTIAEAEAAWRTSWFED